MSLALAQHSKHPFCHLLLLLLLLLLHADEDVEYAEPNFVYKASQTNDQYTNLLWGMLPDLAGANAVGAWNKGYTDCSDVVIGVIGKPCVARRTVGGGGGSALLGSAPGGLLLCGVWVCVSAVKTELIAHDTVHGFV